CSASEVSKKMPPSSGPLVPDPPRPRALAAASTRTQGVDPGYERPAVHRASLPDKVDSERARGRLCRQTKGAMLPTPRLHPASPRQASAHRALDPPPLSSERRPIATT